MSSNPNQPQPQSYSTFTSTSYTSHTTPSGTTARHTYTDPSGTTVTDARATAGERPRYEQTRYETGQPRIIQSGTTQSLEGGAGAGTASGGHGARRIEDVTDMDEEKTKDREKGEREDEVGRKYRDAMEDEYAKREGGA